MAKFELHVISFSIPFPADYGGAIDVFYKIKSLFDIGAKVHLHCFQYDRAQAPELEKYCQSVHYYSRNLSPWSLLKREAFIIESRKSESLVRFLIKDEFPILIEGLHCCAILDDSRLNNRKMIVRSHNIEHDYYRHLAEVEKGIFKRWYFQRESKKLARAEARFYQKATELLGISEKDTKYLRKQYGKGITIPAFHQCEQTNHKTPSGNYAFYHGNLSVGENNEAAMYLINTIFNDLDYPLIIAGNSPSSELVKACEARPNVTLKSNLNSDQILEEIAGAQINVLPTFQNTGIKLKLLAALFQGRHCLVNTPMVHGTGLEKTCVIADTPSDFKAAINRLANSKFSEAMHAERIRLLLPYNNRQNAHQLMEVMLATTLA